MRILGYIARCPGYETQLVEVVGVRLLGTYNRTSEGLGEIDVELFRHVPTGHEFELMSPADYWSSYMDIPMAESDVLKLANASAMLFPPNHICVSPDLAERLGMFRLAQLHAQ